MASRFSNGSPNDVRSYSYYAILNDGEDIDTVVANEAPKDCASGSTIYFVNTGDVYMFYSLNSTWYKQ